MTLAEYLDKNGLTPQEFAPLVGVKWAAIYRYINGVRIPNKEIMHRIFKATKGAVTPNDIFGIPPQNSGA